jgi:hypothetical protein
MSLRRASTIGLALAVLALTVPALARVFAAPRATGGSRVFELRTYHTNPGKMEDLHKRFREHTIHYFKKHGIEPVGFWTPQDDKDGKADTLVYLVAFPSREAAEASWKSFRADPGWQKAFADSHKNGPIVKPELIKSVFLDPTDYSLIK